MVGKMYDVVDILIQRMHVYKFIVNDYLKSFIQIILDESQTMIFFYLFILCPFSYFKLKKKKGIIFVVERSISQEGASS